MFEEPPRVQQDGTWITGGHELQSLTYEVAHLDQYHKQEEVLIDIKCYRCIVWWTPRFSIGQGWVEVPVRHVAFHLLLKELNVELSRRILFRNGKEWHPGNCYSLTETWKHYTERNK